MSTAHCVGGRRLFFHSLRSKKRMRVPLPPVTLNSKRGSMHDSRRHCEEPEPESLTCYQTYRSTPREAAKLKADARAACVSVSHLTRVRVHGHPEPVAAAPAVNLELYGALKHSTDNLNRMTKHANSQVVTGELAVLDLAQVKSLLLKMEIEVSALRADLIGVSKK